MRTSLLLVLFALFVAMACEETGSGDKDKDALDIDTSSSPDTPLPPDDTGADETPLPDITSDDQRDMEDDEGGVNDLSLEDISEDAEADMEDDETSAPTDTGEIDLPTQCQLDSECPDPTSVCAAGKCDNGYCTVEYVPAGQMATVDNEIGDCMWPKCTGYEVPTYENWDADVPDPLSSCMTWKCVNGDELPNNQPLGTPCEGTKVCNGFGVCAECLSVADCPGEPGPCSYPVCNNGVCDFAYESAGLEIGMFNKKDCIDQFCDGWGIINIVVDDTETPPDDVKECTMDYCSGGQPHYDPLPAGSPCTQGLGKYCDGAGNCVDCMVDIDCGPPAPCFVPRCSNEHQCYNDWAPNGTVIEDEVDGNCQSLVCDGGYPLPAADNNDTPVPSGLCQTGFCENGVPKQVPNIMGTPCGTSNTLVCDGLGFCLGCSTPTQCFEPVDPCTLPACDAGMCKESVMPVGTSCGDGKYCSDQGHCV